MLKRFTKARILGASALLAAAGIGGLGFASPAGAAVSTATINYACTFPILGAETLAVTITETAPSSVTPGQSFSLTDVQSTTVLPSSLVSTLTLLGSSVSGTVTTFDVDATNATPATLNAAATPISFGPVTLTSGDSATIVAPSTPETVGPFTAGSSGTIAITPGDLDMTTVLGGNSYAVTCTPPATLPSDATVDIPISSSALPIGAVGGIGLAAVVGAGFVWRQRRVRVARPGSPTDTPDLDAAGEA